MLTANTQDDDHKDTQDLDRLTAKAKSLTATSHIMVTAATHEVDSNNTPNGDSSHTTG